MSSPVDPVKPAPRQRSVLRLRRPLAAAIIATTLYFVAVAVLGVTARYRPLDLALLIALWALFSLWLVRGAAWLASLGRAGEWIAAGAVGLVAVWHLREQTFTPDSLLGAVATAVLLTPVVWWASRPATRAATARRHLVVAGAGLVALAVLFVAVYAGRQVMRWHLLRHNTMLGTPAYYLLETPVRERLESLFTAAPRGTEAARLRPRPRASAVEFGTGEVPHIVFVLLDTLRADALAAWGGDPSQMPVLETFLADSWRLTDVIANASWTRPSVASFFTGLLPEEHGARDVEDPLEERFVTLAEELRRRGFFTAAFVANLAAIGGGVGFEQGFERFAELEGEPYARAGAVNRTLRKWLESDDRPPAPLFLFVHYLDPHEPYLAGKAPGRRRARQYRRAYRRELAYLDGHLGELFQLLERELEGPRVVAVVSDHGEELFEHGLFGHGHSLYDEVIRIPVAVHVGDGGGATASPLEGRDLFDLVLAVAAEPQLDVERWARESRRERRYTSVYYTGSGRLVLRPYQRRVVMRGLVEGDRKLVWSAYGDTRELYDLGRDPGETDNLAAVDPETVARMEEDMDRAIAFWTFPGAAAPSERALEQLRALGYVD